MLRGVPASTPLKYRRGFGGPLGFWNPRVHRVAPICIPIGTHLPHAVGLAWAAKIRRDDIASLVWFGEGATSEGDFHEAMNFASVFKVATVFFCVNNQWAISTPVSRQMAVEAVADKAVAYAMPEIRSMGSIRSLVGRRQRMLSTEAEPALGPHSLRHTATASRLMPPLTTQPSTVMNSKQSGGWLSSLWGGLLRS
jgi:hypothetical protein